MTVKIIRELFGRNRKFIKAMAAINFKNLNSEQIAEFMSSFDTILADCDGVLWRVNDPIDDAANVMNAFHNNGRKIFYVTNNSTKSRDEVLEKFKKLNFIASSDNIVCTSYLVAKYLHDINFKKKVYLIGSTGVAQELDKVGIPYIGLGPDPVTNDFAFDASFPIDEEVGAVVVGFDHHFSLMKMMKAATYLNNKDIIFIGTNIDPRFPARETLVMPGTGSMVKCIETCSERSATLMGKPAPYICSMLMNNHSIDPKRTLMIGDSSYTDILFGKNCGFKTLLVLTGVTNTENIEHWKKSDNQSDKKLIPDYYTDTIADLLPHIKKLN